MQAIYAQYGELNSGSSMRGTLWGSRAGEPRWVVNHSEVTLRFFAPGIGFVGVDFDNIAHRQLEKTTRINQLRGLHAGKRPVEAG